MDAEDQAASLDFGILLGLAYDAFVTELRAAIVEAGHPDLHRSFGYVARNLDRSSLTLSELAERLGVTAPGALKIVNELDATGYVERVDDPADARVKRVRLTKKGRRTLELARRFHAHFEAELTARLGARKLDALREVLTDVIARRDPRTGAPLVVRPM